MKSRYLDENVEDQSYQRDLQEQYEPVVAAQERMTQDITDQLIPMKDETTCRLNFAKNRRNTNRRT